MRSIMREHRQRTHNMSKQLYHRNYVEVVLTIIDDCRQSVVLVIGCF